MSITYTSAAECGLALGNATRLTHQATLPLHKAFVKADKETQAQMRFDFVSGYIAGVLKITQAKAEVVLGTSRKDRTVVQQRAYAQASDKFAYHIVRSENTSESSKSESNKSEDVVALCKKYVDSKNLTKAQLKKLIALLSA